MEERYQVCNVTLHIIQNHRRRRHPSDHDGRQVVETQDEYDEIIWIISTIDIREEPADDEPKKVQETDAEGNRINDTCKEKEDHHKDFPKLTKMRIHMRAWIPAFRQTDRNMRP